MKNATMPLQSNGAWKACLKMAPVAADFGSSSGRATVHLGHVFALETVFVDA